MTIKELVGSWEEHAQGLLTKESYSVKLTIEDAAKIEALAEMYPRRTADQLVSELVSAALAELECSFPYIAGNEVATVDEFGDPVYKDTGPTPEFLQLSRKHLARQHKDASVS